MSTRKEKMAAANAAMSEHPDMVAAAERASRRRPVKRKGAFGKSSGEASNTRFHNVETSFGKGYIVGAYSEIGAGPDMVLVCISKDDFIGVPLKGPCKHIPMSMSQVKLVGGEMKFDAAEVVEVPLDQFPDEESS